MIFTGSLSFAVLRVQKLRVSKSAVSDGDGAGPAEAGLCRTYRAEVDRDCSAPPAKMPPLAWRRQRQGDSCCFESNAEQRFERARKWRGISDLLQRVQQQPRHRKRPPTTKDSMTVIYVVAGIRNRRVSCVALRRRAGSGRRCLLVRRSTAR